MKRISVWAIAFVLLIACVSPVLAESAIDFTGYTLEELLQIQADLKAEIAARPGGGITTLGAGQYKIGEDLSAGQYSLSFVQNGDEDVTRTDYYIYENESMYKYDVDRLWLGDMPQQEGSLKGDGRLTVSLYEGEYLILYYNGAEIERLGDAPERASDYVVPEGTTIPKGEYTVGSEIPAGTYNIYFSGTTTSRVRVFTDADEADNMFNDGKETILNENNTSGMITLADGNVLRVEYTPIIMTKSEGFKFD